MEGALGGAWPGPSTLSEDQHGTSQLDPIAVAERPSRRDGLAVDAGRTRGSEVMEKVSAPCGLDLGMPPRHGGIAEDPDLGAFVEAHPASRMGQQIDPPLLAPVQDLDPGAAQGLFDQGQAQPQPGTQHDDPHGLSDLMAIAERDPQPFEE